MAEKQEMVQPEQLHFKDDGHLSGQRFCLCYCIERQIHGGRAGSRFCFSSAGFAQKRLAQLLAERRPIPLLIITAHRTKALGVYVGSARLRLGGRGTARPSRSAPATSFSFRAGVAPSPHRRASPDFGVCGSLPGWARVGFASRVCLANAPQSDRTIAALPIPDYDPIYGADGPLRQIWESAPADRKKQAVCLANSEWKSRSAPEQRNVAK